MIPSKKIAFIDRFEAATASSREDDTQVNVRMPKYLLSRLKTLAGYKKMSTSKLVRTLLLAGIQEIEAHEEYMDSYPNRTIDNGVPIPGDTPRQRLADVELAKKRARTPAEIMEEAEANRP